MRTALRDIAGAKIEVSPLMSLPSMGSSQPYHGADPRIGSGGSKTASEEVAGIVRQVPGTREVVSSLTEGKPELQVHIDRARAAAMGLTSLQISNEISAAMQGKVVTQYKVGGQEVDIRVGYDPSTEKDMDYLTNLSIMNPAGIMVKLSTVAGF